MKISTLNTLLLLSLLCASTLCAQRRVPIGFAYWDVDNLYDTTPSLFYDDTEFTPKGRYGWDEHRYKRKVQRIAAVLDSMRMPIVALYGVENEEVVRDIVIASNEDYSYVHRTLNGRDGLDFALLYFGDILLVEYVQSFSGRIYIEGMVANSRVGIWLTRSGYLQRSAAPPHRGEVDATIVAGGLYKGDITKMGLVDHTTQHERLGRGNAVSYRGWYMRHRIGTDKSTEVSRSGAYINSWLLTNDHSAPLPTHSKGIYYGGYSSYLPLFIYFCIDLPDCEIE